MKNFIFQKLECLFPSESGDAAFSNLKKRLAKGISFQIKIVKEKGRKYYVAESINTPGINIITTGENIEDLLENIKDATFTAFEVPRHYFVNNYLEYQYGDNYKQIELKYATAA